MLERQYRLDEFIISIGNRMLNLSGNLFDTIDRAVQHQSMENVNVTYQNGEKTWFTNVLEKRLSEGEFHISDARPYQANYSSVDKIIWQVLFAMNQFEKHEIHNLMSQPFESQEIPEWDTQQYKETV